MPGSEQAQRAAVWASPVLVWGRSSPPPRGAGLGLGAPQPGHSASSLSAGSAIFSPSLTLFLFPLLSRIMSLPL